MKRLVWGFAAVALAPATYALNFEPLDGLSMSWSNRIALGAAWRMEARNPDLIGKLNLTPDLCDGDDCRDFGGDPAPNQRLVDAPGGFAAHNQDNGNLNYEQYDPVAASLKWTSELSAYWRDVVFRARGELTFDAINYNFENTHANTRYQPRHTARADVIEDQVGARLDLLEAFVAVPFTLAGHEILLSVGEQRVRWGEATTIQLNSLNEINPPDQNLLYVPGVELADIFKPVGMVSLTANLNENTALELLYQYRWEALAPAAAGSFMSTSDIGGGGDYAVIAEGQFPEDPDFVGVPQGTLGLISSSSASVPIMPESYGEPRDGGQYGVSLRGYLPDFYHGVEWGLYFLNYHSRLPYGSIYATDAGCWREASNLVGAIAACGLFNGSLTGIGLDAIVPPELLDLIGSDGTFSGTLGGLGKEPVPLDTLKVFLDYPEDIRMFGVSFNTTVGLWSLAGEYSYRPNLPAQVHLQDLVFAGVNPVFPRQEIVIPGVATIPTAQSAVPNFIESRYRRNSNIQPNQLIRGWEALQVGQLSLTGIRIFSSSNPIGADQIILITEAGFTHVMDMPGLHEMQFDGGGANATHAGPGADGSGSGGVPDTRRIAPTQQTRGFADDFAWGYRVLARLEYNDFIPGVPTWRPILAFFHDVDGVSIAPMQNFIEGRRQFVVGSQFEFSQSLSTTVLYQGFFGGGDLNKLDDRDHLSLSLVYTF